MKEAVFAVLFLSWLVVIVLWLVALVAPNFKLFNKLKPRFAGRKGLTKVFAPLFVGLFIAMVLVVPPVATELKALNLEADQEVISEQYLVEGEISGDLISLKINNVEIGPSNKKFSKALDLQPGNNKVSIVLIGKDSQENEVEIYNKTHNIFFDYEGMLYAQDLEKDKRAEDELQRKLSKVPLYEIVRKADINSGFSAIVYIDGDMEDYLISNVVKDIDSKNQTTKNMSLLLFSKNEKNEVEAILEKTSPGDLVKYIRANFEKKDSAKQLFWFPQGAEGEKLALEVS
jgi:hypothetical protein